MRSDLTYYSHIGCPSVISFILVENELYFFCPCIFFHTWDRWPSLFHIGLVHTGSSIFTRSFYPKILPLFLQWICFSIASTLLFIFEVYAVKVVCTYVFLFFLSPPMEIF